MLGALREMKLQLRKLGRYQGLKHGIRQLPILHAQLYLLLYFIRFDAYHFLQLLSDLLSLLKFRTYEQRYLVLILI